MEPQRARRRPVIKAALGGAVAVGAVGGAVRLWPGADPSGTPGGPPALALAGDVGDGIGELAVPLDGSLVVRRGTARWETEGLGSTPYSMLALTWQDPGDSPVLDVRTRAEGQWSDWRPVSRLHDLPDAGSEERVTVGSTDLIWTGASDGVQVRVGGLLPRGLTLVLLQPWARPEDATEPEEVVARQASPRAGLVPRPPLRGRRRWGADESWRDGWPRYNRTIQQVHVHHTVNSNDYGRSDVPALIRGMYRYHTKYLGWSDIAYNFLVDRFGRTWTGRAGGARRPVRGAHTLGFNATSTGVSVIGNFELATPSDAVLDAVAAVAAWKLQRYHRDPHEWVEVWSEGSDRFRLGRTVTLPTIDGHRDTNDTACPGRHLYAAIPGIRKRSAELIERYSKVRVLERPVLHGRAALGETLTVEPGAYTPADVALSYVWLRNDTPIPHASGRRYDVRPADVGTRVSVRVVAHRSGLEPHHLRLWSKARTTCPVEVVVDASAKDGGRLRVAVHVVSPPGVRPPAGGKVVVKVGHHRDVVALTDGRGVARFGAGNPLSPGRYRVRARYLGDRAHEPGRAVARVRVGR